MLLCPSWKESAKRWRFAKQKRRNVKWTKLKQWSTCTVAQRVADAPMAASAIGRGYKTTYNVTTMYGASVKIYQLFEKHELHVWNGFQTLQITCNTTHGCICKGFSTSYSLDPFPTKVGCMCCFQSEAAAPDSDCQLFSTMPYFVLMYARPDTFQFMDANLCTCFVTEHCFDLWIYRWYIRDKLLKYNATCTHCAGNAWLCIWSLLP